MKRIALPLVLAVALAGCPSDPKDPSSTKTSLGTAAAGAMSVELLTDDGLETGRTPIYIRVKGAGGTPITDATVTFTPVMTMTSMGGMQHSAPVIGTPTIDADGFYRCDAVFQMASMGADTWSATIGVTPAGASLEEAVFSSLTVTDSGRARTFLFPDPGGTRYVASLNFVGAPKVGLNPVVVTLHSMAGMMSFPAVDDATFVLDPQMPSMGHGSPGSVNPTLTSPGVYEGELSFSMAGEWETTLTVTRASDTIGAPVFTTTF